MYIYIYISVCMDACMYVCMYVCTCLSKLWFVLIFLCMQGQKDQTEVPIPKP